ncbi:MAG: AraC family transcriptional regulator [Halieaceae bacterium]|nr:AraC family transcriptional regulator [Halieaceae bacterium]
MGSPQEFVESYLSAWNDQDAPRIAGHLCSDGTYVDVPGQQTLAGESLIEHLVDYFSNDEFRYEIVGDVLSNGKTVAFQYRVVPRDPTSDDPGWGGAEFIVLDGDTATQISDYYLVPGSDPGRGSASAGGRRYAKSGLGEEAMNELLAALDTAMVEKKTFLDPDLSLPKLAESLDCSVNHLSQAINAGHKLSFFDYINRFRVAEAARMLRQKDCQFPAILDVALSVGFNSTSTFYTAFKKATGQTPASYRKSQAPL